MRRPHSGHFIRIRSPMAPQLAQTSGTTTGRSPCMKSTKDGGSFPIALNKFTVSPRNNLKSNADGSVTLYFQNETPGADKEANWLPAPKGDFIAMLRMYWPKGNDPSILNGTWTPPAVAKT